MDMVIVAGGASETANDKGRKVLLPVIIPAAELVEAQQKGALIVRGINIRKPDGTFFSIGDVAKVLAVMNPAKMEGASDDEKKGARELWKAFSKEYNSAKEKGFQQNDAQLAVMSKHMTAKTVKLVRNKAGQVVGVNGQYRLPSVKSAQQIIADLNREKEELKRQILALTTKTEEPAQK